MREYGQIQCSFWTDHHGAERKVPTTKWRLDFRNSSHRALRSFVFIRDGFKCQMCGISSGTPPDGYDGSFAPKCADSYLVVDHIVSRCRGDGCTHHPDNLQTLCDPCNARKRNLTDVRGGK